MVPRRNGAGTPCWCVQVNSRTHVPQKLTCLVSAVDVKRPCSNRPFKPLTPLLGLGQRLLPRVS
jgi:hypothetical protein